MTDGEVFDIANAKVDDYRTVLVDRYRPPSKGGNGNSWHMHVMFIGGERYSFRALGRKQRVFASDTVSFSWAWNETKRYRNVVEGTLSTRDRNGEDVVRGFGPQYR